MSFYCHAKKEVVSGETMVLVPTAIRKTSYTGFFVKKGRGEEKPVRVTNGFSEGWEIVEEVAVCKSEEENFKKSHEPKVLSDVKKVNFYKPRKKVVEKVEEPPSYDRDFEYEKESPVINKIEEF